MGFRIEDGKGRGRFAAVDHENRLEVSAVTLPLAADRAHEGNAFSIMGEHTLQASATEENVLHFQNGNADKHVHFFSTVLAVETSNTMTVRKYFSATRTSGGTSKIPVQLNRGSAAESGVVAYDNSSNNLVLGTTSQVQYCTTRFGSTFTRQLSHADSIILGPGDTFHVTVEGNSGAKITATIFIYESGEVG